MIIDNIQILNILVDNSNPDFPYAIIKVWWRLNCMCTSGMDKISYQCSTNFTPQFNENYVFYENITNEIIQNWIVEVEGEVYTNLVNKIRETVTNQVTSFSYNTDNYIFLVR